MNNDSENVHLEYLKNKVPALIKNAPVSRLVTLADQKPVFPEWYINANSISRQYLTQLINDRVRLQGPLGELLEDLQADIHKFAEPLLVQALKDKFNLELDVNTTSLRLYTPAKLGFGIDTNASRLRQNTLLQAALHNFEPAEALEGAFRDGSGIFTLDAEGAPQRHPLTVAKYATLCRDLDIGAQYQQHIAALLKPVGAAAKATLEQHFSHAEKATFSELAMIAYLKKDVSQTSYFVTQQIRDNQKNTLMAKRPLHAHSLSLLGVKLTGVVLFSAVADPSLIKRIYEALVPAHQRTLMEWSRKLSILPGQEFEQFKILKAFFANGPRGVVEEMLRRDDIYEQSHLDGTLIAYVPDDPDHPFKEYDSFTDFMKELTSQLRSEQYQEFFSRFVPQKDKGKFFARVRERFSTFTWQQREPLDMGPWWRETAVENPDAEPITNPITGDLWSQISRWRSTKALADTRLIAVPTDDEDAAARWARLTSYLDIGWNVFNFGAMLVPGLGEAMLGVMVGQMLLETMEGIEDWSKGDKEEAAAHLTGVLINFAQLAIMAAGHVLPAGAPTPIKPSPFVDTLKRVELGDGKNRLWNPDLSPYEHKANRPPHGSKPNGRGLHHHNGQDFLARNGRYFALQEDPLTGQARLRHPDRPSAYQPKLEHNGAGAWQTELDRPHEWDSTQLMRRLGPTVEDFDDATLEHVRIISGVEEDLLRRLHVENEPPPALLIDAIKRFNVWAEAGKLPEQILENRVPALLVDFLPSFMTELPRWPESKGIELLNGPSEDRGRSIKYGDIDALAADTFNVTRAEVLAGKLPEKALAILDEAQIRELLGSEFAGDNKTRVEALQNRLAMHARSERKRLFDTLYSGLQRSSNADVLLLQDAFKQLPSNIAEQLLASTDAADLRVLATHKRIPLQVREHVRAALLEVRLARAYEGLFLHSMKTPDTERLILHTLPTLPNWSSEVRIEIREYSFSGRVRDSIGPEGARVCKVLVGTNGDYMTRDADDLHLHGRDSLFASVLHALPDAEREALGYEVNQGAKLKEAVQRAPLARDTLRSILAQNPVRKPAYDPVTMKLRGGMHQGIRQLAGQLTPQERVASVRPGWTEAEVQAYLDGGGSETGPDQQASALEDEFNQLNTNFRRWMDSPTQAFRLSPTGVAEWQSREALCKAIRQCWQHIGLRDVDSFGDVQGAFLDLSNIPLGRHLGTMPALGGNFGHVTSLNLSGTELADIQASFLDHFPRLRVLNLINNQLTKLPRALRRMRGLTELYLHDNQIVLDAQAVADLRNLTLLTTLDLQRNPLGRVPDIGRMSRLHTLALGETGIHSWPDGLFSLPRFRHFYLNLQRNTLATIPQVVAGSADAELLSRTVLSRDQQYLSTENLNTLRNHIRSVGLDPDRPYPARGVRDSVEWGEGLTRNEWAALQLTWDDVEDEFGSVPFFNQVRKLTESAHFKSDQPFRLDMTRKLWRMLEAMSKDSQLRKGLFALGREPTTCVDAGAQLFNAMGVEVLIHEAYQLANPSLVEAELVLLARGKSRLDELSRIAHKVVAERLQKAETFMRIDATGNVVGTIDEVEVHLAYMTDLAERLDLPWQSRDMQFRTYSDVTDAMVESAYQRVLDLESGDLLCDSLIDQPFWKSYVEGSRRSEFKVLRGRINATTEFYMALDRRATDMDISAEAKAELKEEIRVLAAELKKPEHEIAPGRIMTQAEYEAEVGLINAEMNALLKTLTQQAMDRAKLQRVEMPFTVESTT